jgi:hypothetical protein
VGRLGRQSRLLILLSFSEAFFANLRADAERAESRVHLDAAIAQAILGDLFEQQRAVIEDPYPRKAVLCPRRAGKSWTAIAYAFHTALTNPGGLIAIVTLTAGSAQRIYWSTLLRFGRRYGLNLERQGGVNHTSLTAKLENGSTVFLVGAGSRAEIEKLRGNSYDLVVIDECKSFNAAVLQELTEDVLDMATADSGGTIMMIGTPGSVLDGPFYEATFSGYKRTDPDTGVVYPVSRSFAAPEEYWSSTDHLPEWSFHRWTLKDNTKVTDKHGRTAWENALLSKKRKRWADDNPKWRREGLGEWATSEDVLVYAFSKLLAADGEEKCRAIWHPVKGSEYNKWGLPADQEWRYILGIDYGFEDDTAIVVLAYSTTHDTLYQVYDWKDKHLTASQAGEKCLEVQALFDNKIEVMVCDGQQKQMIQDLNERYGLGLVAADKNQKYAHVELLNSDLYDGKFKVLRNSELVHEWIHLQWDLENATREELIRRGKLIEDKRCANHLADACLYAHHYSIHFFAREKHVAPTEGSPEWLKQQREDAIMAATRKRQAHRSGQAEMQAYFDDYKAEMAEHDYQEFRDTLFN